MQNVMEDSGVLKQWRVEFPIRTELEETLNMLTDDGYEIYSIETVDAYPDDVKEVIAQRPGKWVYTDDDNEE